MELVALSLLLQSAIHLTLRPLKRLGSTRLLLSNITRNPLFLVNNGTYTAPLTENPASVGLIPLLAFDIQDSANCEIHGSCSPQRVVPQCQITVLIQSQTANRRQCEQRPLCTNAQEDYHSLFLPFDS